MVSFIDVTGTVNILVHSVTDINVAVSNVTDNDITVECHHVTNVIVTNVIVTNLSFIPGFHCAPTSLTLTEVKSILSNISSFNIYIILENMQLNLSSNRHAINI